jgi:NTE family protein
MQLARQIDELRSRGSSVATVFPDAHALSMFGSNMMDLSTRPPAARAGCSQGRALAEQLTRFWR